MSIEHEVSTVHGVLLLSVLSWRTAFSGCRTMDGPCAVPFPSLPLLTLACLALFTRADREACSGLRR
jgi:hypothetical protein